MEVTQMIASLAGDYAETLALRGYDAVQLASASAGDKASAASWTFMSFDRRLNRAARVMGLAIPVGLPV
jgi:predicted nucleic acid-binding protein